ncbi:MAG: hypothetical protein WAP03_16820 [Methylorubrum rhodinum]|uniref:hypothetical protein n=1 Tax=Methylorubrum rhodinum TaxID=29428 RepID=UPI003BAF6FE7
MKRTAIVLALVGAAVGPALGQTLGSIDAYGSNFELSPFAPMQASVAVASDKNGRKFNVLKLPNGKMMALIAVERVRDYSPFADDSEMMYGDHKGSSR